eukprot:TRINITY_DN6880_c0_g1_i2.p3 TRINITY_DN6880_c0_g1~~TRINITY_DN6880_c0_g1_i2.p3  ORF type:complete len:175 (+),score=20.95 TRINITY_DN6880_c0_g1_i2:349-873(+)
MGESMGGLVSYTLGLKHKELVDGVVLMNPAIGPTQATSKYGWVASLIGKLTPRWQLFPRQWGRGSKNPAVDEYFQKDPYFYKEKIRPGTIMNLVNAMHSYGKTYKEFMCPFLIVQGGRDVVVDPKHAFRLVEESPLDKQDKHLLYYENMWHTSWFEEEIHDIMPEMIKWFESRL